jgi:hypothetical protein
MVYYICIYILSQFRINEILHKYIYIRSESRVYPYLHITNNIIYQRYHCTTVLDVRPVSKSACYRSLALSRSLSLSLSLSLPPLPSLCLALLSARWSDMIYIMHVIIDVHGREWRSIRSSRCLQAESGSSNPLCMDYTRVCIVPVCRYDGMLASYRYCG